MAHKLRIMRGLVSNLPSLDVGELALTTDANSVKLWAGTTTGNIQVGGLGLKPGSHSHILSGTEITGVLPISKGGTGATTVSEARKALEALKLAGSGTSAPSDSLGEDGDLYIQYV